MLREHTTPVSETINMLASLYPLETRGYIIALPAVHANPLGRVRWYMRHTDVHVMAAGGTDYEEARVFPSYAAAMAAAQICEKLWGTKFGEIRIVEVTRQPPIVVHADLPISVLDALAEI